MDSRIRWLRQQSKDWQDEGIITAEQRARIDGRYDAREDEPSLAVRTFYVLGGVLLAAAVFAFWMYLTSNDALPDSEPFAWMFFAVFAAIWLAIGTISERLAGNRWLGEAFLVAGLLQSLGLAGPDPGPDVLWFVAPAIAAGLLWWRRGEILVPLLAFAALEGTVPLILERFLHDDPGITFWLVWAVLLFAGMAYWTRGEHKWPIPGMAIAAIAAAIAWIAFTAEVVSPDFEGGMEVVVAAGLAALLGVGLWLRDRPTVYVGGLGLTADAVVFAFDLGGVGWGLTTLAVLSAGLIVAASLLRQKGQGPAAE